MVEDITRFAVNKPHLVNISREIAKPLRSRDSPLDYLPSQYLVEFIKSKGYAGVKYNSTLRKGGYNIAIFNPDFYECLATEVIKIKKMEIRHKVVI